MAETLVFGLVSGFVGDRAVLLGTVIVGELEDRFWVEGWVAGKESRGQRDR